MKRFVSRRNGRPVCNIDGVNTTVARLRAELVDRGTLTHFKAFCGNRFSVRKLDHGGPIMRWFHMAVICVFAAAVIIFAAQNLETGRHALPRFQRHPISTHQAVGGLLPVSLRGPNRPPLGLSCHSIFSQGEPQLRGDATKPNAGCLSDLMVSRSDVATPERCRGEL